MEIKQKKVKNIRPKLKLFRASEPEKSVLMWGISYSISNLSHVQPKPVLLSDDFKASMKVAVDNNLYVKDHMPKEYKFKEYSPMVFQDLRRRFGVTNEMFLESFTMHQPRRRNRKEKEIKSSFMLTWDKRFAALKISSEELESIQNLLLDYHAYIVSYQAVTYLPKWLALYRIIINDKVFHTLIIANIFYPPGKVPLKVTINLNHDLEAEKKSESRKFSSFIKEHEFISLQHKIGIGQEKKNDLLKVLQRDIEFLTGHNFVHMRLLIGISGASASKLIRLLPNFNKPGNSSTEEELSEESPSDGENGDPAAFDNLLSASRRVSKATLDDFPTSFIKGSSGNYYIGLHSCLKKRYIHRKKFTTTSTGQNNQQQQQQQVLDDLECNSVSPHHSRATLFKCGRLNDFFSKYVE